jgi:hypothetical protein
MCHDTEKWRGRENETGYTSNFVDISGSIVVSNSGGAMTNYMDSGGVTNVPSRLYRIRLVP